MKNCIFCQIADHQIPAQILYEDDQALVFKDINPRAPVHLLVIPRKHIASVNKVEAVDRELFGHLFYLARQSAEQEGVDKTGYRLVVNTGKDSGQDVFHLHMHLLGGRPFSWPPG